jgi:hypothetical protein
MKTKSIFKSKIVWGGVASIAMGIYLIYTHHVNEGITSITTGLWVIFSRLNSNTKLTLK